MYIAHHCKTGRDKGVSLHEIMVTLFIVNIALFSIIAIVCVTLRANRKGNDSATTIVMANSILERYVIKNNTRLGDLSGSEVFGDYKFSYKITVSGTEKEDLYQVKLELDQMRIDGEGKLVTQAMTTLVKGHYDPAIPPIPINEVMLYK